MSITLADLDFEDLEDYKWTNRFTLDGEPQKEGPYRESFEWIGGQVNDGRFIDCPEAITEYRGIKYIPFSLNPESLKNWKLIETREQAKRIDQTHDNINLFLIDGELSGMNLVELPLNERRAAWLASFSKNKYNTPNPSFLQSSSRLRGKPYLTSVPGIDRIRPRTLTERWDDWIGPIENIRDANIHGDRLLFIYQAEKIHSLNHSRGFPLRN